MVSSSSPGTSRKMLSLETSGIPRRTAVAAIHWSASPPCGIVASFVPRFLGCNRLSTPPDRSERVLHSADHGIEQPGELAVQLGPAQRGQFPLSLVPGPDQSGFAQHGQVV